MEQKGTIVALDQWSQPTAPVRRVEKRRVIENTIQVCVFVRFVYTVNPQFLPVARIADFDRERDQTIRIQFMLRPPEWLSKKLFFSPPFAAT